MVQGDKPNAYIVILTSDECTRLNGLGSWEEKQYADHQEDHPTIALIHVTAKYSKP